MFEGSISAKAEKMSQRKCWQYGSQRQARGLGSRFPTCLFHLELDKLCPSEEAPDTATLLLLCVG